MLEFVAFKKMQPKNINFLFVIPILFAFVGSHELPKQSHGHYTFEVLQDSVHGESLSVEDVNRLFTKLNFLNCSENKKKEDFRRCFSPTDLYQFNGSSDPKALNASDFLAVAPVLVYCLLPAPEKNSGSQPCVAPKNHSELHDSFVRNFSQQAGGITHEALDKILEKINKTIGEFLSKSKCFSAESIFEEVHHDHEEDGDHHDEDDDHHDEDDDHHDEDGDHHHEDGDHHHEDGDHHEEEGHDDKKEEILDPEDFQKACASIIFHLVQGFCIEEGHGHNETSTSNLPSKEFFINELFEDQKYMSEDDLGEIVSSLGIGRKEDSPETESDGHNHRRKRSVHQQGLRHHQGVIRRREVDDGHDHDHDRGHGSESNDNCYSLDDLLTVYEVDHSVGVDKFDFKELCPAFIQQVKSKACHASSEKVKDEDVDMSKVWGYGFAAVTIISITSLMGVATIPFLGKKWYKKILALLVALAVGTLAGDSLLHLLPHAFGLHEHEENVGTEHDHEEDSAFIWKALVVLASIYGFFLFETLMHLCLKSKIGDNAGHSHIDVKLPGPSSRHMSFKKKRSCSNFEHHEGGPNIGKTDEKPPLENGDIVLKNVTAKSDGELDNSLPGIPQESEVKPKRTLKQSLSRRSVFTDEEMERAKPPTRISAVAWMIIIGDTLHNISDGLAIGAAFAEGGSSGISGGISTSIAVFCHELPHELGDFAVLLTAGMSVKMALLANLLSALSCYIGLAIGIYVGQSSDVRFWIFAVAAGMFLYVALVDMLPDLMHSEALQTDPAATFAYQNFGLLLGICIMLVIALYEEDLMAVQF